MEELLKPHVIQEAVLNFEDQNGTKTNDAKIKEMEKKYGVAIGVVLESSKPDKATQDMKRTPAMAEALRKAMNKLMENDGMNADAARRAALILDPNNDYSEELFDLHVTAPDLKNLRDVNIVPPGTFGGNKKGGKK